LSSIQLNCRTITTRKQIQTMNVWFIAAPMVRKVQMTSEKSVTVPR